MVKQSISRNISKEMFFQMLPLVGKERNISISCTINGVRYDASDIIGSEAMMKEALENSEEYYLEIYFDNGGIVEVDDTEGNVIKTRYSIGEEVFIVTYNRECCDKRFTIMNGTVVGIEVDDKMYNGYIEFDKDKKSVHSVMSHGDKRYKNVYYLIAKKNTCGKIYKMHECEVHRTKQDLLNKTMED